MKSKQEYFVAANSEPLIQIKGMTTGQDFSLREYTYGVLVPDCKLVLPPNLRQPIPVF